MVRDAGEEPKLTHAKRPYMIRRASGSEGSHTLGPAPWKIWPSQMASEPKH